MAVHPKRDGSSNERFIKVSAHGSGPSEEEDSSSFVAVVIFLLLLLQNLVSIPPNKGTLQIQVQQRWIQNQKNNSCSLFFFHFHLAEARPKLACALGERQCPVYPTLFEYQEWESAGHDSQRESLCTTVWTLIPPTSFLVLNIRYVEYLLAFYLAYVLLSTWSTETCVQSKIETCLLSNARLE